MIEPFRYVILFRPKISLLMLNFFSRLILTVKKKKNERLCNKQDAARIRYSHVCSKIFSTFAVYLKHPSKCHSLHFFSTFLFPYTDILLEVLLFTAKTLKKGPLLSPSPRSPQMTTESLMVVENNNPTFDVSYKTFFHTRNILLFHTKMCHDLTF